MWILNRGHVFQLLFSNAQSTNEPGFLSNAEGNWEDGDIFFDLILSGRTVIAERDFPNLAIDTADILKQQLAVL